MNIFDKYSAYELRDIFRMPTESWDEDFCNLVNQELANDLLDAWLENADDKEYRERIREVVENITYGYEDKNGKEMLDFDDTIDDNGNYLLRFNKE
jgi:hypothetical protein